jgi:hypothetical protein
MTRMSIHPHPLLGRPRTAVLLLVLVATSIVEPGAASATRVASAANPSRCKNVSVAHRPGRTHTHTNGLFAINTSCGTARRVARIYLTHNEDPAIKPLGYRCRGGADGVSCRKGRRTVTWGYTFD